MRDEIEELEQKAYDYRKLLEHPGWKQLEEVIDEQVKGREVLLHSGDDDSLEGWAKSRRLVGERQALLLIKMLPGTIIEQTEEMLNERRSEDE